MTEEKNIENTDDNKIDIEIKPTDEELAKRKRLIAEKKFNRLNVMVIGLIFVMVSLFLFVGKRPTVSETENRSLTTFPEFSVKSLLSGEYTGQISEYYNDTVPLRAFFKSVTSNVRSMMGVDYDGVIIYGGTNNTVKDTLENTAESTTAPVEIDDVIDTGIETTVSETTTPLETEALVVNDDIDDGVLSGGILVYHNRGIPIYYGSFDVGQQYASYVNAYKVDMGASVNVYSLVAPTAQSFYMPEKYASQYGSEYDNLQNIKQYLNGVTEIDAYDVLMEHKDEAIYARTDHHWTSLGAYYATQLFAKQANVPFTDISKYDKTVVSGYVGTLYGWSQVAALQNNPEDFIFYTPKNQYTTEYYDTSFNYDYTGDLLVEAYGISMYCTFMGGDEKIVHVNTDQKNGRTLAIIKDSYGNAMVPFLTSSFENIYVIDMRNFNLNAISFMKEHGVTDVLFAMNTFSATGGNSQYIQQIRTQ